MKISYLPYLLILIIPIIALSQNSSNKRPLVQFDVKKFEEMPPNLDGVGNDSAIENMKAVMQGFINVPMRPEKELKRFSYQVLSFEITFADNGKMVTMDTTVNRLSYNMRDQIDKMSDGSTIQINKIRYAHGSDTFTNKQPLRVYIIKDSIMKF